MYISKENGRNHVAAYSFTAAAKIKLAKAKLAKAALVKAKLVKDGKNLINKSALEDLDKYNDDEEYFV